MNTRERFEKFHRENPAVYEMFKRFTFEAIRAGKAHLSAAMVVKRIRWETNVVTTGDQFKINDQYTPHYSRLFMEDFPEHDGFFFTRRLRAA